jgi:hypothetical protein
MVLDESLYSKYQLKKLQLKITMTITNTNNVPLIPIVYSLDLSQVLNIKGLTFKDTCTLIKVEQDFFLSLLPNEQAALINSFLSSLDSHFKHGFLNSEDLTILPLVSEFLPSFFNSEYASDITTYINGEKSKETYKWLYNLIILTLYFLCCISLQKIVDNESIDSDLISDFKYKERVLFSRVDASIRHHMRKRGLSLIKNTYIGFDTEFNQVNRLSNSLVSAQLAITSGLSLKVPNTPRYTISSFDVEKNKLHKSKPKSEVFNYSKVETSIQWLLQEISRVKNGSYDESMVILTEGLKTIKGMKYYEADEQTTFNFPRSEIQPYIAIKDTVSLKELLHTATLISTPFLNSMSNTALTLVKDICSRNLTLQNGKDSLLEQLYYHYHDYSKIEELAIASEKQLAVITQVEVPQSEVKGLEANGIGQRCRKRVKRLKLTDEKTRSRELMPDLFTGQQSVNVTSSRYYYLAAHLTAADLTMLSDFALIKEELNIVNGSFVTLRDPLNYCGKKIHIRDTMLLAPGGSKSLARVGMLYGEAFHKITISKENLKDMKSFFANEPEKFIDYALRDALISLKHSLWMDDFNFNLGGRGVPLSLSSIGRRYVKQIWEESKYSGYQVSQKYSLGDVSSTITPKGLNEIREIGFLLPYYIANYKGGRNECFMYGVDTKSNWFDYDLTSAYTTVMSMAGHPDYAECRRLSVPELQNMSNYDVLYSYMIIHADFEFPESTKYPSIPCFVDENCTVFPLKGRAVLTGSEYLLAKAQGCNFVFRDLFLIPFKKLTETKEIKPFNLILKQIQEKRREYPKGTINNLMYKEIGNSIYGSVVRGISNKRKYDTKTKTTQRLSGDELSNPIIASWTTAFIRSIIGECLDSIQQLEGLVVSVTTDGFITNIVDLENKISEKYLFSEFKQIRKLLSDDDTGLELKNEGRGMLAWTTRGQLGIESNIKATTGLQHNVYNSKEDLLVTLTEVFKSDGKTLEYIQSRLRSATEIFKKGGHVTMVYKDQHFRMHFDNKRVIEIPLELIDQTSKTEVGNLFTSHVLLDSKPLKSVSQGENLRYISKLPKIKQYSRYSNFGSPDLKYKKTEDLAVINFIKGIVAEPPMFNLHRLDLKKNKHIVEFIKQYDKNTKISANSIAALKGRAITLKSVPRSKETEEFVKYVKSTFQNFDEENFYRGV